MIESPEDKLRSLLRRKSDKVTPSGIAWALHNALELLYYDGRQDAEWIISTIGHYEGAEAGSRTLCNQIYQLIPRITTLGIWCILRDEVPQALRTNAKQIWERRWLIHRRFRLKRRGKGGSRRVLPLSERKKLQEMGLWNRDVYNSQNE